MKSIRGRLLAWLLPGLGLLLGMTGTALYLAVKHGLESRLDAELRGLSGPVRFLARERMAGPVDGAPRRDDFPAFNDPAGRIFFTIWPEDGASEFRSESLGGRRLPRPDEFTPQGDFHDVVIGGDMRVRMLAVRAQGPPPGRPRGFGRPPGGERFGDVKERMEGVTPGEPMRAPWRRPPWMGDGERGQPGPPRQVYLVVAKDRSEVDDTLRLLLGIIAIAGAGAAFGAALLVKVSLGAGLRPLERLGDEAGGIDAGTLGKRFATEELPEELRPITGRLNDLMARLETGFERERRFGADLAHELRTPVAELRSLAEVALKWPDEAPEDSHTEVLAIASRMQRTIENLLRLTRLEHQAGAGHGEPAPLADLLREVWRPFAPLAVRRGLTARFEIDEGVKVGVDPELLRTILVNLLSNAAEYAAANSEIVADRRGEETVLEITNAAPDLAADDLPHMFERLWRKDRSRTDGDHSGLGLALARACAEARGWRLDALLEDGRLRMVIRERQ